MYWRYLKTVLIHKYFVLIECIRLGIPWLGIIHDWTKLTPAEFFGYAHKFGNGGGKHSDSKDEAFRRAWLHHQRCNKHHWQNWIVYVPMWKDDFQDERKICIPIPDRYRRELLADWIGAGKAYRGPGAAEYYEKNRHKIYLHPETRRWLEDQLGRL